MTDGQLSLLDSRRQTGDLDHLVGEVLGTRYGDTDLDGLVDEDDFETLARNFGAAGHWSDGDTNGDGHVNFADFVKLANSFGLDG